MLTIDKRLSHLKAVCIVGVMVSLSFIVEICLGSFPVGMFSFPLNILVIALWVVLTTMMYRNRANNACAVFMLSREATWLSLVMVVVIGITLGLQRKPSTTAWPVVLSLLFIQNHLLFVILRGWRNRKSIRWRFCVTHIGLLLALGAGFWGAPDREKLRAPIYHFASNEAFTQDGKLKLLPYTIELKNFLIQQSESGAPTHYEAQLMVDDKMVTLKVNHPYYRTLSEKIYLVSFATLPDGEKYAIIEIVNEPWQWLSATGIIMLIAGAMLLFVQGPKSRYLEYR
ncbi:MAG: cytochrome c biogenesis protein ResB [Bacteroidaceae bacterium]|nr:cytochrome c biogenesis protein ResB [Bacteroidaceae bacterium]